MKFKFRSKLIISEPLVFKSILIFILAFWLISCNQKPIVESTAIQCHFQTAPCHAILKDGTSVEFKILPYPIQPLTELTFELRLTNQPVKTESVELTLTMPTMSMPENRVHLLSMGEGLFIGKGSIVRCISGDRLWNGFIELNRSTSSNAQSSSPSSVNFQFEVQP